MIAVMATWAHSGCSFWALLAFDSTVLVLGWEAGGDLVDADEALPPCPTPITTLIPSVFHRRVELVL
jgi:hypothetical protein